MFGHDDHHPQDDNQQQPPTADGTLSHDDQGFANSAAADDNTTTDAGQYLDDLQPAATAPAVAQPEQQLPAVPVTTVAPTADPAPASDATTAPVNTDQLLDIKQQALQQLTPLVGHLDQTPEEKFRTTMMMIQAADNHELIQVAYQAAQQISDEKAKAQALLDIVNEINYFTHSGSAEA